METAMLEQYYNDGVYFINFYADWCGTCKKMKPTIEKLESEFVDIKFLHINVDECSALVKEFDIRAIPAFIIMNNGKEINRVVGMSMITPLRKVLVEI